MRNTRLPGHALKYEGRVGMAGRLLPNVAGPGQGEGRAECTCGEYSPVLPSTSLRRFWHSAHKDEVRAAAQEGKP